MKVSPSANGKQRLLVGGLISVLSVIGLLALEAYFRPQASRGLYFQGLTSEMMMQTVSISDLQKEPVQSLWYLHIQPPMFDFLRAVLVQLVGTDDYFVTMERVDSCLSLLWILVSGALVFTLFWWLSSLTNIVFGAIAGSIFTLHPAFIFYATHLDTTLLSTFFIFFFIYLLWRIKEERNVSPILLGVSFILLFFTRSIFQWQWLLFLPFSLFLLGYPKKKILLFMTISFSVVGLYSAKQIILFGTASTSSFSGLNLCRSINVPLAMEFFESSHAPIPEKNSPLPSPRVLSRVVKENGMLNFNQREYLEVNRKLSGLYKKKIFQLSPSYLLANFRQSLSIYLAPSSSYSPHIIVDKVFWRWHYDAIFSYPVLPILLLLAFFIWRKKFERGKFLKTLGFLFPVFFIVLVCIAFEQGENMRFKFFVEPLLFCFLADSAFVIFQRFRKTPVGGDERGPVATGEELEES